MIAIVLCLIAFFITLWAGVRSLSRGLLVLFSVGYVYGIVRANLPSAAAHFIFDASLVGLYLSQKWSWPRSEGQKSPAVRTWAMALIAWPFIMCLVPFQTILVTLVGLRGNVLFLPLILLGCRLKGQDLRSIANGLAVLNLFVLGFAMLEYFLGIESFFPRNELTETLFNSADVAGGSFRIPSTFLSAHVYAGTMVMTLPWLFGAWSQRSQSTSSRRFYMLGIVAALCGILLSATRVHFVVAALLLVVATFTSSLSVTKRLGWITALALVGLLASGNDRLQRFTTLSDTDIVTERVSWGVNQSFLDIVAHYPFGNGLGGGGTSIPFFLRDQVRNPVFMENEYARIVAEQGLLGLLLWVSYIVWHFQSRAAFQKTLWLDGRRLGWFACSSYFVTAMIGTGLLTSIPQSAMILLCLGWISTPVVEEYFDPSQSGFFAPMRRANIQSLRA